MNHVITFFGRFHPLIVHLPIGFIFIAIVVEALSYIDRYSSARKIVPFILLVSFIAAVFACVTGLMLSYTADYQADVLGQHKWAGIILAVITGLAWVISTRREQKRLVVTRTVSVTFSIAILMLLTYTGHLGGSLTHGEGFLSFEKISSERVRPVTLKNPDDPESPHSVVNPDIPKVAPDGIVEKLRAKNMMVRVMLHEPLMLDISLPCGSGVSISAISRELEIAAPHIIWLNLSDNSIKVTDLDVLTKMSNLEKLRLEKNPVDDGIVSLLRNLKHLESVNLNETLITSNAVNDLKKSPNLKVYFWKTKADISN